MQHIKRFAIITLTLLCTITGVHMLSPAKAYAADAFSGSKDSACSGATLGESNTGCVSDGGSGLTNIIKTVLSLLSLIIGIVAVIMVIIGGFRYVLSGGDSNATNSARNTIIYALVGLIIAAVAQVMVHFVLNKISPIK